MLGFIKFQVVSVVVETVVMVEALGSVIDQVVPGSVAVGEDPGLTLVVVAAVALATETTIEEAETAKVLARQQGDLATQVVAVQME